jgi:hypothetical protein
MKTLHALRDLLTRAIDLEPEDDSDPGDADALLAGLEEILSRKREWAKSKEANQRYAKAALNRRTPIDPVLSPFEGAWQILNPSESFYVLNVGSDKSQELHQGPNYSADDPREALSELVEKGVLQVYPPGLYSTDWTLSTLGYERRLMKALSLRDLDAARACLPHVRAMFAVNARQRLEELAKEPAKAEPQQYAKRLHTATEARPDRTPKDGAAQ